MEDDDDVHEKIEENNENEEGDDRAKKYKIPMKLAVTFSFLRSNDFRSNVLLKEVDLVMSE